MKILITSELPGKAFEDFIAASKYDVLLLDSEKRKDLKKYVKEFSPDGMITLLSDRIDRETIDLAPDLKVVSNYAVGFNNIDVDHCIKKGITVTNTPDVLTDATADIAFLLLLMAARKAVPSDRFTREGKFKGWEPSLFLGRSLNGKTLGIFGFGRIGQAVAKRASAFGLKIVYWNRSRKNDETEREYNAEFLDFETVLKTSDMISLHLPYVPELHHLLDEKEFSIMKDGAILVNTARGQLVNEAVLAENLKNGKLYAAGLDVYEFEPDVNGDLKDLQNAVLFPHTGSATEETRAEMARMVITDCCRILSGLKAENPVNK